MCGLFAQIVLEISANRDMKDTVRPEAVAQLTDQVILGLGNL